MASAKGVEISKTFDRRYYQLIVGYAFSLDCGHPYQHTLKYMIYLGTFGWLISTCVGPIIFLFWTENKDISMILEIVLYVIVGFFYSIILMVSIIKKQTIKSVYDCIQTAFVKWSVKREMDPQRSYEKNIKLGKLYGSMYIVITCFIGFSPFISAIIDNLPLDSRTHWVTYWPMFFSVNNVYIYAIIYFFQMSFHFFQTNSMGMLQFGLMVIFYELYDQFDNLICGLNKANNYRGEKQFENHIIDCIRQHQLIIKYLNSIKSYFKWLLLIDLIFHQVAISTSLYCLIKVNAAFGYKMKLFGIIMFQFCIVCFHCYLGQITLDMHDRLAKTLYNMTWYEMPNKHKKLIIIMLQYTQIDLTLNSAIFSSQNISRTYITRLLKQIYTFLNVLLNI